ncbi:hypothetical protein QUB28_08245 [Microcoleus sp. B4-C3]|uniref:hypothetical protein n=1 Tax=Microcoleus sp. B4-C2 TaxID=2818661 RepID=UPI002FCE946F
MPVPRRVNFIVEQASCLLIKGLLRMVQHLSYNILILSQTTSSIDIPSIPNPNYSKINQFKI